MNDSFVDWLSTLYEGRAMARHVQEIRLVVGKAEPKRIRQAHGGPAVSFQLHDTDQINLSVEALDAEGNPAAASIAWASSDESIVGLTVNGDGTVTAAASPGAAGLGTATITATATDTSDGDTHVGTYDIEVVASDAVIVNIVAGIVEPKPVGGLVEPPLAEEPTI